MTAINGNILQWYKKARKFEKIISISVLDNPTSNYKVKEMSIINGNLITVGIDEVNNKSFIGIKGNYGYSDKYIKFEEFENTKILSLLCTDDKVIFITKTKVYTLDYNVNSDSFETTFKNFPLSENLNNEIKLIGDKNNIYFYDYNKIYEINITDGNISYILSAPENSLISSITINNDKLIISRQLDNKLYIYNRTEISNNSVPVEYKIADDDVIPTLNSSTAMDLNQNVLSVGLSDGRLFIVNLDNGEESNIGSLFSEISYVDSNGSYSGFIDNEGSIIFYDRNLSKLITIEVNSRSIEGTLIGSNSKSIIDFKMDDIFLTALNNDNTVDLYKLEYIPDLEFNYHMIEKRDGKGKENDTFFLDVNAKLVSDINNAMDKTPYEVELYTNIEKSYLSGDAWAKVDNFPEFVKGARPNVHRKSELHTMFSNNSKDYPNQGYWLTDTDGRLFFRTERINLEKSPRTFSVYNTIGMDYNSNDPDDSGSINTNLVGKKVIISGRWRGSREKELRFMSKVIVDGVTKALPKDNEKIRISTDWQTFSTVIDKVEKGTSIVRFLPSYDPADWETAEGFYLDQKDIKVEIVEEGESEEPTPWIPPITRKLFNPKNIFEGGNSRNPANFQGSNVETTKNVEVAEWGAKDASTFVITGGTHVIKGVMKVRLTDPPLQSDGKTFYRTNFHIRNNHETNTLTIAVNGGTSVSIPPKAIGYFGTPTNQHVANNNLQFHFQVDDPSMDINCTFWNPEFYAYDIEHGFTEKAPESSGSIIYDYEYVGKFDLSLGEDRDNPNNYHWSKRKQKISTKKLYQEIGLRKNLYLPLSDINDVFASNLSLYMDSNSNDNKSSIFYKIKNKNNNIEINNNEVKLDRIKKLFIKDLYKFGNDLFFRYMFICNNSYAVKLDFNNKASTLITFNESRELYKNIFNLFNPKSEFELKVINKIGLKQFTISNLIPRGKYTIRTDYINTTSQYKDIFFTNNSEQAPDSSYNGVDMNKSLTISANKEGKLFISLKEESSGGKLLVRDLIEGRYNIYLEPALGGLTDSVTIVKDDLDGNNGRDPYAHKMYSNDISFGDYDYSGNPNLSAKLNASSFSSGTGATVADDNDEIVFTLDGTNPLARYTTRGQTPLVEGKEYTISCEIMLESDFVGDPTGIKLQHAYFPGGILALQTDTVPKNELNTWQTLIGTRTISQYSNTPTAWYPIFRDTRNLKSSGKVRLRNIKIEEGPTATPYQPNLLDAPYYLSKTPLGENILRTDVGTKLPITTTEYMTCQFKLKEPYVVDQTYTFTMKATKPATQYFAPHLRNGILGVGKMTPVAGLTDVWQITYTVTQELIDRGADSINIFQMPQSTKGTVNIEWAKLEKGDTRTPNIDSYDYIGFYNGNSSIAPNDPTLYRWNNFIGIDDKGHSYGWSGDIGKNEIYDISNYEDPFTKFHLFKLKNAFDIINDDKFNINITLYNNGEIIETSSINNLEYREVSPNKNIKYKTSDGDIKYIEELLLTELEQGNKDRFMHNNSLVPQNRIIPNSEISISNGTYVGEEVNDEGLTGYITIPFNARDIGDLYKSDYIIMDIYVNGYRLDRKYAKERYNLNDGSLRVDYPVKNIYRFISDDEYNQISSGIIPDSVKFMATIRRKSLISSEKVIGKYRVTDQFQNDIEMLQSTGIYIPFVGKDSDLTSSELRLFIRNKVNSLARRVNPDNYTMRLDKQNKQVLVKLNGTTNIEIGSEIIIASNGLLDNNIYYINNNRDYPMDSLPLVTFDSENNMYTGLIYDEEDIDISVNGLTLIPRRDYNILDPDIDSIPSMITFKNYIPLGSTIEINYLEEKTNHVFNWDNPAYGTQNRFVLDDDRFIFVKGTFELFVNNLKLDNESFNIINNRTIEIINIEPKYLKNVMVRFSYRDHTNLKLIQDSYKFNNIDINDNGYHSKFEGKSPNNFDKLSNGVSTDISKILLMNKLNTNDKLVIDCNDDNLQSDIYLDSRYIENQYINRDISINANSINRINEDTSINNPEI